MKKTLFIFGIIAITLILSFSSCKNAGSSSSVKYGKDSTSFSVAYVDLDRITKEYRLAIELTNKVNAEGEALDKELNRRGSKIERDYANLQEKMNRGLLVQYDAEIQAKKIQEAQANFQNYLNAKQAEMQNKMIQTQEQIANSISTFIKTYNETAGYTMILTTQGAGLSVPVVAADESLDITDDIIEGLNKQYEETKDSVLAAADSTKTK